MSEYDQTSKSVPASNPVPAQPQVFAELNRYDDVVEGLEAVVEVLASRLDSVLLHHPNVSDADASPVRMLAPVAERIARSTDRVAAVEARLSYLLQTLEV